MIEIDCDYSNDNFSICYEVYHSPEDSTRLMTNVICVDEPREWWYPKIWHMEDAFELILKNIKELHRFDHLIIFSTERVDYDRMWHENSYSIFELANYVDRKEQLLNTLTEIVNENFDK